VVVVVSSGSCSCRSTARSPVGGCAPTSVRHCLRLEEKATAASSAIPLDNASICALTASKRSGGTGVTKLIRHTQSVLFEKSISRNHDSLLAFTTKPLLGTPSLLASSHLAASSACTLFVPLETNRSQPANMSNDWLPKLVESCVEVDTAKLGSTEEEKLIGVTTDPSSVVLVLVGIWVTLTVAVLYGVAVDDVAVNDVAVDDVALLVVIVIVFVVQVYVIVVERVVVVLVSVLDTDVVLELLVAVILVPVLLVAELLVLVLLVVDVVDVLMSTVLDSASTSM